MSAAFWLAALCVLRDFARFLFLAVSLTMSLSYWRWGESHEKSRKDVSTL
jgi:hypothetical protein